MIKFVSALCFIYLAFVGSLYLFQRSLQYFPDASFVHPEEVNLQAFSTVQLLAADGTRLVAWHAEPRGTKPTIVYFQGNAQGMAARWERFRLFNDQGYGVLALGYRGYSGSEGQPSEAGLLQDGRAALAYLKSKGIGRDHIIIYGESLGTGVATQLAAEAETRPAAMILESPFTSAADVARTQYWFVPVSLLMKDQFRSIDHVPQIEAPIFVMHGDADAVIPFQQGRRVFNAVTAPKEFLRIPGGRHVGDLTWPIWNRIDAFIQRHRLQ